MENAKNFFVFGPRFNQEEWDERSKQIPLFRTVCSRCGFEIMLRESARALAKIHTVLCRDCVCELTTSQPAVIMGQTEVEQMIEKQKKARLN